MGTRIENYDDDIEIDLIEIFLVLLHHWILIILSSLLVALIVFAYNKFLITPLYSSTSSLYVLTKSTSITSLADIQTGSKLTQDYLEIIGGRPILDQVIEELDLDITFEELSHLMSYQNKNDTRILEITCTCNDPEQAKIIVDKTATLASNFISEKMDQDKPSIIQNGYVNYQKVSPRIVQSTLLGGLAGAFIAIVIVVLTYLMNDTIMVPDDLEKKVELNVLATIPFNKSEDVGNNKKHSHKGKKLKKGEKACKEYSLGK